MAEMDAMDAMGDNINESHGPDHNMMDAEDEDFRVKVNSSDNGNMDNPMDGGIIDDGMDGPMGQNNMGMMMGSDSNVGGAGGPPGGGENGSNEHGDVDLRSGPMDGMPNDPYKFNRFPGPRGPPPRGFMGPRGPGGPGGPGPGGPSGPRGYVI